MTPTARSLYPNQSRFVTHLMNRNSYTSKNRRDKRHTHTHTQAHFQKKTFSHLTGTGKWPQALGTGVWEWDIPVVCTPMATRGEGRSAQGE